MIPKPQSPGLSGKVRNTPDDHLVVPYFGNDSGTQELDRSLVFIALRVLGQDRDAFRRRRLNGVAYGRTRRVPQTERRHVGKGGIIWTPGSSSSPLCETDDGPLPPEIRDRIPPAKNPVLRPTRISESILDASNLWICLQMLKKMVFRCDHSETLSEIFGCHSKTRKIDPLHDRNLPIPFRNSGALKFVRRLETEDEEKNSQ